MCYRIGIDILRHSSFNEFCKAYHDEKNLDIHDKAECIRTHLADTDVEKAWTPTEAKKSVAYDCEISKLFRAYDTAAMKKK